MFFTRAGGRRALPHRSGTWWHVYYRHAAGELADAEAIDSGWEKFGYWLVVRVCLGSILLSHRRGKDSL
jgi:hypothetical protein